MNGAARPIRWLPLAGALMVYGASLLPWLRSGSVDRNAYAVADVARAFDLAEEGLYEAGVFAWYFMPAAVAVVLLALTLGRTAVGASVAAVIGAVAVVFAGIVSQAPVGIGVGVPVTIGAGFFTVAAAVGVLASTRRTALASPRRTSAG